MLNFQLKLWAENAVARAIYSCHFLKFFNHLRNPLVVKRSMYSTARTVKQVVMILPSPREAVGGRYSTRGASRLESTYGKRRRFWANTKRTNLELWFYGCGREKRFAHLQTNGDNSYTAPTACDFIFFNISDTLLNSYKVQSVFYSCRLNPFSTNYI